MKKVLIGLFALITSASFGQVRKGNNVVIQPQFGVFGGLAVANQWTGDDYDGYSGKSKASGIVGLQLALPISYGWYIQPEVTYSRLGTRYFNDGDYIGNVNANVDYLSVPVLFKYSEPFTGIGILFGPQYGYLLSAKDKPTGSDKSNFDSYDLKDYYNKSDLSGVVGLEYYFPNNGQPGAKFGFSARYQFGFLNINKALFTGDNGETSPYQPSIRNNAFFLTAGIRF